MPSPAQAPLQSEGRTTRLLQRLGPRRQEILFASGAAIVLVNIAILAWTSQQSQSQAQWASHSLEVQNKLSDLLLLLRTAESEQRAYMLADDKTAYRAAYLEAAKEIPDKLREISAMVADNPSQQARLAELEPIIQEKLEDLAIKVRLLDGGDMAS